MKNKTAAEGGLIVVVSCRGLIKKVLSHLPPPPSLTPIYFPRKLKPYMKGQFAKSVLLTRKNPMFLSVHVYLTYQAFDFNSQTGKRRPTFHDHNKISLRKGSLFVCLFYMTSRIFLEGNFNMLFYTYQYKYGQAKMLLQVILLFCKKVSNRSLKTQKHRSDHIITYDCMNIFFYFDLLLFATANSL